MKKTQGGKQFIDHWVKFSWKISVSNYWKILGQACQSLAQNFIDTHGSILGSSSCPRGCSVWDFHYSSFPGAFFGCKGTKRSAVILIREGPSGGTTSRLIDTQSLHGVFCYPNIAIIIAHILHNTERLYSSGEDFWTYFIQILLQQKMLWSG